MHILPVCGSSVLFLFVYCGLFWSLPAGGFHTGLAIFEDEAVKSWLEALPAQVRPGFGGLL